MARRVTDLLSQALHSFVRRTFYLFPGLRQLTLWALEPVYRLALFPFRRAQGPGMPVENEEILQQTDKFNEAAERYYADHADPEYLVNKPFSDTALFHKHLIDVAVLVDGGRIQPGDTVVELGAGSCWLSHFLNRYGCKTIAIDVSRSALGLGEQLFQGDSRTKWELGPQFIVYDGWSIPLDDTSCDRIIVSDAFHHIPNQKQILTEMYRILRNDGIVAMSEPGRGHASMPGSVAEMELTGVLENELVLEDLAALAESIGFLAVSALITSPVVRHEIPARSLGRFVGGRGFARYWKAFCSALDRHHYILMYKGSSLPTSARPGALISQCLIRSPRGVVQVPRGDLIKVTIEVRNLGDTIWLNKGYGDSNAGWTRLGVHLCRDETPRYMINLDWHRVELEQDVKPGDFVTLQFDLPPIGEPGAYILQFDLVVEGMTWFEDHGARPSELEVTVE